MAHASKPVMCSFDDALYDEHSGITFMGISKILMERDYFSSITISLNRLILLGAVSDYTVIHIMILAILW